MPHVQNATCALSIRSRLHNFLYQIPLHPENQSFCVFHDIPAFKLLKNFYKISGTSPGSSLQPETTVSVTGTSFK